MFTHLSAVGDLGKPEYFVLVEYFANIDIILKVELSFPPQEYTHFISQEPRVPYLIVSWQSIVCVMTYASLGALHSSHGLHGILEQGAL